MACERGSGGSLVWVRDPVDGRTGLRSPTRPRHHPSAARSCPASVQHGPESPPGFRCWARPESLEVQVFEPHVVTPHHLLLPCRAFLERLNGRAVGLTSVPALLDLRNWFFRFLATNLPLK